ncbi:MAG: response regulator transcription factor [Anaerolineae bacterium]|nr:response regulator transcription factor [Anaerolineales bacterium]MCQ3977641.1 DNA-binding response regulator [Anaerolineae bacterium]
MTAPIRILLADDHPIFRRGLYSLLNEYDDLQIIGEADSSPSTLEQVAAQQPDVLLLDVRMGGANGIEIARELRRTAPDVRVIILTTYDNDEYLFGALQVGAHAYLLKDVALDNLPAAIRAVHQGERLLSPQLVDRVLHQFQTMASEKLRQESGLSVEELRILDLIAAGETNQAIAEQFFWSEVTVKKKVQEILAKLGATNRAQAVALAIRRGLI